MQNLTTEKRITNIALWLFAACVLVILLTSCSPYAKSVTGSTFTPAATVQPSANLQKVTLTPAPSCTVTAGALYLRHGAAMSAAALDVLHSGDVLRVIYHGQKWTQVETPQRVQGWIYAKYCEVPQ